jgi:penicillin G amidase
MRRLVRICARVAALFGLLVLLLVALAGGAIWQTLPTTTRTARVPGLHGPVDITYDADWVPRIHAGSDLDGAAALGFLHAQDRMFQLEMMRRVASGRLSEIAGPATLRLDRLMRTLGLRRHAEADYAALAPDTKAMLEAYARGVNAWIALKGRFSAPEFLVLGAPAPWQPSDSLLWAKMMGLSLSMNWRQEMSRAALADKVSPALLRQLWPARTDVPGPDAMAPNPMAPASTLTRFAAAAERVRDVLPTFPEPFMPPQTASNEWAVDGRHSATGAPLLAGDPHLQFGFPSIWYLTRIDTPQGVLAGATAPGVPILVLGRNSHIAWTFTTNGADVQDVFVETPAGPGLYQTPDGPRPFTTHEERIKVRGEPDQVLTVRETRHGPVISDLDKPSDQTMRAGPIMAVAMENLQPNDTAATGLLALNRATSVQEAGVAAAQITSPVQNLLVADGTTIGMFTTGIVPIRKTGDGSMPAPGDGSHDWVGAASGLQLPHRVAPESGRLVNANEPTWPTDFPVFMAQDTFADWRARRIQALLQKTDRHSVADFVTMQADVTDGFAQAVLPRLRALDGLTGRAAEAQALLRDWDGQAVMSSPAPLIFVAWMDAFYDAILTAQKIPHGVGAPVADFVAAALASDHGSASLCGGDCAPLLVRSLETAVASLQRRYGDDPKSWRWGDAHHAVFAHPLLQAVPLLNRFSAISIPAPGDDNTIDRGGTDTLFRSVHGPSYRAVYDLSDLDRSVYVMAPGQSGNLFSRHARDFVTRWRDGATITLGPAPAQTEGTVRLTP